MPAYASMRRSRRKGQCVRCVVDAAPDDIRHDDLFPVDAAFREDLAVRSADEALTPELDARPASTVLRGRRG